MPSGTHRPGPRQTAAPTRTAGPSRAAGSACRPSRARSVPGTCRPARPSTSIDVRGVPAAASAHTASTAASPKPPGEDRQPPQQGLLAADRAGRGSRPGLRAASRCRGQRRSGSPPRIVRTFVEPRRRSRPVRASAPGRPRARGRAGSRPAGGRSRPLGSRSPRSAGSRGVPDGRVRRTARRTGRQPGRPAATRCGRRAVPRARAPGT